MNCVQSQSLMSIAISRNEFRVAIQLLSEIKSPNRKDFLFEEQKPIKFHLRSSTLSLFPFPHPPTSPALGSWSVYRKSLYFRKRKCSGNWFLSRAVFYIFLFLVSSLQTHSQAEFIHLRAAVGMERFRLLFYVFHFLSNFVKRSFTFYLFSNISRINRDVSAEFHELI